MKRLIAICAAAALLSAPAFAAETRTQAGAPTPPAQRDGIEDFSERVNPDTQIDEEDGPAGPPAPGTRSPTQEDIGIGGSGDDGRGDRDIRRQPTADPPAGVQQSGGKDSAAKAGRAGQPRQQGGIAPDENEEGVMSVERQMVGEPGSTPEISGVVLRVDEDRIMVDHFGSVVPLEITRKTEFGEGLDDATDLREGIRIRAEFNVVDLERNVAERISIGDTNFPLPAQPERGVGGAGEEGQPTPPPPTVPESDFAPVPDPALTPPTDDPSIMGQERESDFRPRAELPATNENARQAQTAVRQAEEAAQQAEQAARRAERSARQADEAANPADLSQPSQEGIGGSGNEDEGGAVFDTGDISQRQPALIEEGFEPGPASPLPAPRQVQ